MRNLSLLALIPLSALLCLPDLSTFQLGKAVLVGPLIAALLPGSGGRFVPASRRIAAAALVVVLVGAVALVRSPSPGIGAWELWLDLLFLGALLLGAGLPPRGLLMSVSAAGGTLAGVTALEALGLWPLCPAAIERAGTMGNPNFTGAMLALAAASSFALFLVPARLRTRLLWACLLGSCLASIFFLGSWTGAVAAGLGLAATGLRGLVSAGRGKAAMAVGLLVLGIGGAALSSSTVRGHLADRLYMARVSWDAGMNAPLAGHGLGGFPRAFLDAQAELLEEQPGERGRWTRALHAHSEPLHGLTERGIPGLLAWLTLWGLLVVGGVRAPGPHGAGLSGLFAAGFALSLGEFPGHLVPVQLVLGLAAGGVAGGRRKGVSPEAFGPTRGGVLRRGLVLVLAAVLFLIPPWLALSDRSLTRGDPATALLLNPWSGRAAFSVALVEQDGLAPTGCYYAGLADQLLPSPAAAMTLGLCEARRGRLKEGIAALERAAHWNPRSAAAHGNLALLLLESGDLGRARRHALRAASLRPGDPQIQRLRKAVTRDE